VFYDVKSVLRYNIWDYCRKYVGWEAEQWWGTGLKNYDVKMEDQNQVWKTASGKIGVL
jgi:hypothetical protein